MKIYLDMDGVLTNFNKKFEELFGVRPTEEEARKKHFYRNWEVFVKSESFEKLEKLEDADTLLEYVISLRVPVEILSSSGGKNFHEYVTKQKNTWLVNNGISFPVNIVPGGTKKALYASPWNILVDDTESIIDRYRLANGTAILHTSANTTIRELSKLHLEWQGGQ